MHAKYYTARELRHRMFLAFCAGTSFACILVLIAQYMITR